MKIRQNSILVVALWFIIAATMGFLIIPITNFIDFWNGKHWSNRSELDLLASLAYGACLASPLCVLLVVWHKEHSVARKLLIVGLALCLFVGPTACMVLVKGSVLGNFTKGMLYRLESDVDSKQLQSWASTELAAYWQEKNDPKTADKIERDVPLSVKSLSEWSPNVYMDWLRGNAEAPYLAIVWGSGFMHYGLLVGNTDFKPPNQSDFYLVQWRPGIYVFAGG